MNTPVYKTEGIIIKKADLGETDRLLTIYTEEYGKIQARAKSVRKSESKLKGFLELFTYSEFLLAKSKTIDIITDVNPINSFSALHLSLDALTAAFRISKLVDKLVIAPEQDEQLWRFVLKIFQELDKNIQPKNFEEEFLEILGYGDLVSRDHRPAKDFIQELLNEPSQPVILT